MKKTDLKETNKPKRRIIKSLTMLIAVMMASVSLFSVNSASAQTETNPYFADADTSTTSETTQHYFIDSDGEVHGTGLLPEPDYPQTEKKNLRKLNAAETTEQFEEKYRSDEQPWAEGIKVKDQGRLGLCWAYATTTAAEYSSAKMFYDMTGEISEVPELSIGHLLYFLRHRVPDPLGYTLGDGSDDFGIYWPDSGDDMVRTLGHLSTWSGFCTDEKAPFSNVTDHIIVNDEGARVWDGSPAPYDESLAYDDYVIMRECRKVHADDVNNVKSMIKRYGAGVYEIQMNSRYFRGTNNEAYYMPPEGEEHTNPDHATAIVGWDDTYPKENFKEEVPGDGAWVIQNSYGAENRDHGFFYVSYYSYPNYICFMDLVPADTYRYNFQYDGTATADIAKGNTNPYCDKELKTYKGSKASNVYTNTTGGPINVEEVVLNEYNDDEISYTLAVYKNLKDPSNPESGILAVSQKVTTDCQGIRAFRLDHPVYVDAGSNFSIVFTFDADITYPGLECGDEISRSYYDVRLDRGQSFIYNPETGIWTDIYDYDACFRIKAYANPTEKQIVEKSANPMTAKGKNVKVKASAVSKKLQRITKKKAFTVRGAAGKVSFKKTKGNKKITVSKSGRITLKKGLKKGTYKIKVRVTAAGNSKYKKKSKIVTVTIKVK